MTGGHAASSSSDITGIRSCAVWQAYYFPMWDLNGNWNGETRYERWSINMFLFKGSEMGNITEHDDEAQISMVSWAHGMGLLRRQTRSGIPHTVRTELSGECTHGYLAARPCLILLCVPPLLLWHGQSMRRGSRWAARTIRHAPSPHVESVTRRGPGCPCVNPCAHPCSQPLRGFAGVLPGTAAALCGGRQGRGRLPLLLLHAAQRPGHPDRCAPAVSGHRHVSVRRAGAPNPCHRPNFQ